MRYVLSVLLMAATFAFAPVANAAEAILRLGHTTGVNHPFHDAALRFKDAVARLTGGAVEVDVFPNGQLGDDQEILDGARLGTVDLALADPSVVEELQILQLPWVVKSYDDLIKIEKLPQLRPILEPALQNLQLLTIYEGGPHDFLSVKRDITKIGEFQGLLTRVPPGPLSHAMWTAIGVAPTPVDYGEIYTALQTGTIDALEINMTSMSAGKYYEVGKHVLRTQHFYWPMMLVMNKNKFDGLKPEYQKAILQAAKETTEPQIRAVEESTGKLVDELKSHGVAFTDPSPDLLNQLKAKVQPVIENYISDDSKKKDFYQAILSEQK